MGTVNTVVATINGVQVSLTEGSGGVWSASTTAPNSTSYTLDPQYYNVAITATDMASNATTIDASDSTFGANLRLVVKETTAPVITITAPTEGAYVATWPTMSATLTDSGSGIDTSSIVVKLDNNVVPSSDYTVTVVSSSSTATVVPTEVLVTYTPSGTLVSGDHSFTVDVDDNDGNSATTVTRNYVAITSAPVLSIDTPSADDTWTNDDTVTITGSSNLTGATGESITISIDSGTAQTVTVGSTGAWTYTTSTLADGLHTFTVVATGLSGLTTTATRTINVDTVAPTITAVSVTPNPADNGETILISVTVTDTTS